MILSTKAIGAINNKTIRLLAAELNFTETWVGKLLESNKPNGKLTLSKAVDIIMKETGLSREEILEEEKAAVAVK